MLRRIINPSSLGASQAGAHTLLKEEEEKEGCGIAEEDEVLDAMYMQELEDADPMDDDRMLMDGVDDDVHTYSTLGMSAKERAERRLRMRTLRVARRRVQRRGGRASASRAGAQAARNAIAAKYGADSEQARKAEPLTDKEKGDAAASVADADDSAATVSTSGTPETPLSPAALLRMAKDIGGRVGYEAGLSAANDALGTQYTADEAMRSSEESASAALGAVAATTPTRFIGGFFGGGDGWHLLLGADGGATNASVIAAAAAGFIVVVVVAAAFRRRATESAHHRISLGISGDERTRLSNAFSSSSSLTADCSEYGAV